MMKHIAKATYVCLLSCVIGSIFSSCSDFLEEYSQDTDYVRSDRKSVV